MTGKLQFQEKLSGIMQMAKEQNMRLTKEEVERYFEDDSLSNEQIELVYDYLLSQKAVVKGYTKQGGITVPAEQEELELTEEEKGYWKEYTQDLNAMKAEEAGERSVLLGQAAAGDAMAKSRLIEIYLSEVAEIAKEMNHPEVFLGDLIQEGNVSLMLALDNLTAEEQAEEEIEAEIRQGIQALIEEQIDVKRRDSHMVKKVIDLNEKIEELTENTGRKVTVDELALFLDMTEEQIEDILKLMNEGEAEE